MTVHDLINAILDLYNKNRDLERLLDKRERQIEDLTKSDTKKLDRINMELISFAKEKIAYSAIYSWNKVDCWQDEESGELEYTPFNDWVRGKVCRERIPDFMSYEDFMKLFKTNLMEIYDKEVEEEIKKTKEENEDE